ncbi:hypothetical protein [Kordiimonas marina]|uniref:hypothetical protein n=1 Tax=Kordiimonas marina TaxID=2872312 RepID=UPI001FF2CE02|nr:hypothetical protein [Kordiimonas marina]MCJ9429885.1 hypothetical protein [Kordiimonas marina]
MSKTVAADKAATPAQSYVPGLGDIMTAGVQPRHIKLWFAARQKNWPLAAYEYNELLEALADAKTYQPRWKDLDIGEMIEQNTAKPLANLKKTIDDKNEAAFIQAYIALTKSCNSCHKEAEHPFIVVRVPSSVSFPDQDFRPQSH